MGYNILLKTYEGPLDLLYDLITKNKIDIYDISIFEITDQYLKYLKKMEKMDLEVTSDFIIMACKLLEIKSKYLLFKKGEEEEDDPRKELMDRLIIYKKFKNISQFLRDRINTDSGIFYRKREEFFYEEKLDLSNLSIDMLLEFIPIILKEKEIENNNTFQRIYKRENISLDEQINYVRQVVNKEGKVVFKQLIREENKEEIIVTFLSILELIKNREITINQEGLFSDIIIKKAE